MQNKKKPAMIQPPQQVTARDPKTGIKTTSLTRGGAIFKLESMTGKKVTNPIITRK